MALVLLSNAYSQSSSFLGNLWGSEEVTAQQPVQNVVIPKLPVQADFAGERVPLEYFDVRESLQREMTIINY